MTGFELHTSGTGSNRSANWAKPGLSFFGYCRSRCCYCCCRPYRQSSGFQKHCGRSRFYFVSESIHPFILTLKTSGWGSVLPNLVKFRHFGKMIWIFVKWVRDYLVFGKTLDILWQIWFCFWTTFQCCKCPSIKKTIWSHFWGSMTRLLTAYPSFSSHPKIFLFRFIVLVVVIVVVVVVPYKCLFSCVQSLYTAVNYNSRDVMTWKLS